MSPPRVRMPPRNAMPPPRDTMPLLGNMVPFPPNNPPGNTKPPPALPIYHIMYLHCTHNTERSNTKPPIRKSDVILQDYTKSSDGHDETAIARFDRCIQCDNEDLEVDLAMIRVWAKETIQELKKAIAAKDKEADRITEDEGRKMLARLTKINGENKRRLREDFDKKWKDPKPSGHTEGAKEPSTSLPASKAK